MLGGWVRIWVMVMVAMLYMWSLLRYLVGCFFNLERIKCIGVRVSKRVQDMFVVLRNLYQW